MSFLSKVAGKISNGLYDFGFKTFVLPPVLTVAGLVGVAMVATSSQEQVKATGSGGIVFGLGIFAILAGVIGTLAISIPLSLLTGLSFFISVPLSYWAVLAIICNCL